MLGESLKPILKPKKDKILLIKQFLIVAGLVLLIGILLAWYNTGDIWSGLHEYATSIIMMIIGSGLIFYPSKNCNMVGISIFTAGLVFMLTGVTFTT